MIYRCNLPVVPVRSEPSHRSEMITQLLFGEQVEILSQTDEWLRCRALFDGYEGWVSALQVDQCELHCEGPTRIIATPFGSVVQGGLPLVVPAGSVCRADCKGDSVMSSSRVDIVARQFLGAPYLWGGRTILGIDCSGFVQLVYKICGISLPRDAWQQHAFCSSISLPDAQMGDLAFFVSPSGKIVHVGLLLSPLNDQGFAPIIHASGCVRIDNLDSEGIFNTTLFRYTHRLLSVARPRGILPESQSSTPLSC